MSEERNLKLRSFRENEQPSDSKRGWKRSNDFLTPSPHRPRGHKERRNNYQQRSPRPIREPPQTRPEANDRSQFPDLPKKENVLEPGNTFTPEVNTTAWIKPPKIPTAYEVNELISPRIRRKLDLGTGKKENEEIKENDVKKENEAKKENDMKKENDCPDTRHFLMMQDEHREKVMAEGKVVPHRVTQEILKKREKDIRRGYNTDGYRTYLSIINKDCRSEMHPCTPDKRRPCSRRSWDMQIRIWRKNLHHFDNPIKRTEISWKNANFNRLEKDKRAQEKKEARQRQGADLLEEEKNSIEASDLEDIDMELDLSTSDLSVCSETEEVEKAEEAQDKDVAMTEEAREREVAKTQDFSDQEVPETADVGSQFVVKADVGQEEVSTAVLSVSQHL